MFYRSDRGRRDPYFLPVRDYEDPIRLDERRLDAWAMALGQQPRPRYKPRGRPHRGMLPDVDLSRATPVERRPGPIARLLLRLAGRKQAEAKPAEAAAEATTDGEAPGETERKAYVWVLDWDPDAARPAPPAGMDDRDRAA